MSCTCVPCTTPAYGHPAYDHCAACCAGSMIEEYDFNCPIEEHRAMAARQFPGALIPFSASKPERTET